MRIAAAVLSLAAQTIPTRAEQIVLDGGSSVPISETVTYEYKCPDGVFIMKAWRRNSDYPRDYPTVLEITYAGRSIAATAKGPIDERLRQLRTLESVSPRCLTGGGIELLLSGLSRDRIPHQRHTIGIDIDKRGRVASK